jgi:hypothetical protein
VKKIISNTLFIGVIFAQLYILLYQFTARIGYDYIDPSFNFGKDLGRTYEEQLSIVMIGEFINDHGVSAFIEYLTSYYSVNLILIALTIIAWIIWIRTGSSKQEKQNSINS